jgi:hypothetical protein
VTVYERNGNVLLEYKDQQQAPSALCCVRRYFVTVSDDISCYCVRNKAVPPTVICESDEEYVLQKHKHEQGHYINNYHTAQDSTLRPLNWGDAQS